MKHRLQLDIVQLDLGMSLILGHCPEKLPMSSVNKKLAMEAKSVGKFGFWNDSAPDFNKYYPDVTEEDMKPENITCIYPIYRALSEVIVHKKWNPIDFGKNGVLKNSLGLLTGQTIYPNHEAIVGNELGVVLEEVWQDAYTTEDGIFVPAGINIKLKIPVKTNSKIVEGIMMEPPSIHSGSSTVEFLWESSHPSLSMDEFWGKLGTYAEDGELIRRVVTEVVNYHEYSLVSHGADYFAQQVKPNGEIVNPKYANRVSNNQRGEEVTPQVYRFSYGKDLVSLSEKKDIKPPIIKNAMNPQILKLAQQFGISAEGKTEEQLANEISAKVTTLQTDAAALTSLKRDKETVEGELATLKNDLTQKDGEIQTLKTEKTALEGNATLGKNALESLRSGTKSVYEKLSETPDETLLKVIENANWETLTALNKQYTTQLEEKYPGTCSDCGSHNVSRSSLEKEEEIPAGKKSGKAVKLSHEDTLKSLGQEKNTFTLGATE